MHVSILRSSMEKQANYHLPQTKQKNKQQNEQTTTNGCWLAETVRLAAEYQNYDACAHSTQQTFAGSSSSEATPKGHHVETTWEELVKPQIQISFESF